MHWEYKVLEAIKIPFLSILSIRNYDLSKC